MSVKSMCLHISHPRELGVGNPVAGFVLMYNVQLQ